MVALNQWGTVLTERDLGAQIRGHIISVIQQQGHATLDLSGVKMINSSFADEVFGKLIVEDIGLHKAKNVIQLQNASDVLKTIINDSISTRAKSVH